MSGVGVDGLLIYFSCFGSLVNLGFQFLGDSNLVLVMTCKKC